MRMRNADRGPGYSYRPDMRPPSIYAEHQPGIVTPRLDHLALAAYDLERPPDEVTRAWAAAAERAMAREPGALTVTIGLGARVFAAGERPVGLRPLPAFAGDALDPAFCGGDAVFQVCARSAGAAAAALAEVTGGAGPRWLQTGSLRRGPRDRPEGTPRDPLGFRDGSGTLRRPRDFERHVWAGRGDRTWMAGGTYLVMRRIEIDLEAWERLAVEEQERAIGRHKASGAPLGRRLEFDPIVHADLPPGAHAREAAPSVNRCPPMLRRGYTASARPGLAGARRVGDATAIVFLAFMRDPHRQFVPVQRRLAAHDALSAFTRTVGSAVFAVPSLAGRVPGRMSDGSRRTTPV